ncbi:TrmH family RNA methyltransferase [Clostridium uliginosum]|uniref:RNA methyltransferase, TrmH family n=1 Tax=Clostridium uliginosum TaxID=119641 RepID=A0A1I1K1D5_9CLOT|nr:RNA methyltransferase [Clostridium uliginosum]SFC54654.1 RNA methyltransferase, TrmH family [Clostridium uliginosum]
MIFIESKDNVLYKETKKLKERRNRSKTNKYVIEGFRLIDEGFKAKLNIDYLILTEEGNEKIERFLGNNIKEDTKIYCISDNLFKDLTSTENPQGIIAVVSMKKNNFNSYGNFYLLCDKLQDPGNLGTIIRTAHAAGVNGIILTKGTVDIYNEKTIRATMGSLFYIPIYYDEDLSLIKQLKQDGFKLVVTSLESSEDFFKEELKGKVILTVGNEGNGVSDEVLSLADSRVKIPMPGGAESLNVAIATSIIIYEKVRQNSF